ncbi:hypothetical protein [Nonomuraea sp. SYSU D8015]|uniref:hypothetical protein n=1 Tax=Nonomuraea sp. SYSU D8015 TaxID=2593644 RepID=UPI001660C0B5|nr:hypothetical protein [Nonomuraea sp. SYSU D8015]
MPVLARLVAAALLVTMTACADSRTAPSASLPAATPLAPATPHPPAPPLASVTHTPLPTPTASAQTTAAGPQAAEGRDLTSCEDADCEVEIQAGDRLLIDERFGVRRLTVNSLHPDMVEIALLGFSGGLQVEGMNVSTSGSCVNGRCRDEGTLSLAPGEPGRINGMRLELTQLSEDRAVLRLAPS